LSLSWMARFKVSFDQLLSDENIIQEIVSGVYSVIRRA